MQLCLDEASPKEWHGQNQWLDRRCESLPRLLRERPDDGAAGIFAAVGAALHASVRRLALRAERKIRLHYVKRRDRIGRGERLAELSQWLRPGR